MKRFAKIAGGIFFLVLAVFLIGPRPDATLALTFNGDNIGPDPEAYLQQSESRVPGLVPGAEKEVVWHNPSLRNRTPLAIVYIHGFSATKHETRPVPDIVANALGANLYFARMAGHGRDGQALAEATANDWINDFAEAVAIGERLGEKVVVMATSNGAAISTWGLSRSDLSKNIVATVFLAPNFELQSISTSLANMPWAETLLPLLGGKTYGWEPENELHGKWWTNEYPSKAVFPMTALLKVVKEIDKSAISVPAMFVYAPADTVVVSAESAKVANEWGGPTRTLEIREASNPSMHVIAGDILAPENTEPVASAITSWLEETIR